MIRQPQLPAIIASQDLTRCAHFSQHPRPRGFWRRSDQWRIKRMKTKLGFLRNTTHIFFLATVTLLLFAARSSTFAGSAAWNDTGSDWNTATDWTPNTVPNFVSDTATFNLATTFTSVFVSTNTEVAAITFSALATNPFTITAPTSQLTISGTGITNSSGIAQ